jgi:glycerophosphoryl diester phosphodiesterase
VTVAISAHRGGAEAAPPGTLAAYRDALAAGVDYVEFDVERTRDGELVVYHDTRSGRRRLHPSQLTRRELDAAIGTDVLGLDDLLTVIAGKAKGHADLKAGGYGPDVIVLLLEILGRDGFVATGSDAVVTAVKRDFPEVRTALSIGQGQRGIPLSRTVQTRWSELRPMHRVRASGAGAVAMQYWLARLGVLGICARNGLDTMVWTVNDPAKIRSFLADERVGVLVTDRPRYALRVRSEMR